MSVAANGDVSLDLIDALPPPVEDENSIWSKAASYFDNLLSMLYENGPPEPHLTLYPNDYFPSIK